VESSRALSLLVVSRDTGLELCASWAHQFETFLGRMRAYASSFRSNLKTGKATVARQDHANALAQQARVHTRAQTHLVRRHLLHSL
jgi:hypothetical protein